MSDRDRTRRPEPVRVDPVRHPSAAFRRDARPAASGARPPGATPDAPADDPFAWSDDPVSRAVRAGYEVVETAVRRSFGLGRYPGSGGSGNGTPWAGPWNGGPSGGSSGGWPVPWSPGQWVDAMTGAFTLWAQWVDAWTGVARSVVTGGAAGPAGPWPAASPAAALRVHVELRSPRAVDVALDLSPGAGAPGTSLEVHGLLAPAAAGAPPITDVTVAIADGGVTVGLGSVDHHPAGTYVGAVLSAGRACGTLTVRLT